MKSMKNMEEKKKKTCIDPTDFPKIYIIAAEEIRKVYRGARLRIILKSVC